MVLLKDNQIPVITVIPPHTFAFSEQCGPSHTGMFDANRNFYRVSKGSKDNGMVGLHL